ncbi:MAG: hypothetical protein JWN98_2462, partial [Abditibacteriota bacterium]|nr:hypothetical protein [Abditibacteriota bacterium]
CQATGIPLVIGPLSHTWQWGAERKGIDEMWMLIAERKAEVRQFYTAGDADVRRAIVQKYDVRFVVNGELERQEYGEEKVATLDWQFPIGVRKGDDSDPHRVTILEAP